MENKEIINNLSLLGILNANQLRQKDLSFWYLKIFKENLNNQEQKIIINEAKEKLDYFKKDQLIEILENQNSSIDYKTENKSIGSNNIDRVNKDNNAESLYLIGLEFYELKNYERAKKCFTKVIDSPSFKAFSDYQKSDVYSYRGIVLHALGQYAAGFNDHTKSLELSPNEAISFYNRAYCSFDSQEWNNAIDDLSTAINLDKRNPDFYYLRAYAKFALEKYSDALKDIEIILKDNPNNKSYQDLKKEIIDIQKNKEDEELNQTLKGCASVCYFIFFGILTLLLPPIGAIFIVLGFYLFK